MAEVKQSTRTFFIPWVSTLKNVMYCMSESPSFILIWVVTNMSGEYRALFSRLICPFHISIESLSWSSCSLYFPWSLKLLGIMHFKDQQFEIHALKVWISVFLHSFQNPPCLRVLPCVNGGMSIKLWRPPQLYSEIHFLLIFVVFWRPTLLWKIQ